MVEKNDKTSEINFSMNESGTEPISLNKRESWIKSATVWAGCEFSLTVIMTGSGIISSFTLKQFIFILLFSIICITWPTDGLNSYLGALTGRSSGVIARSPFGSVQAKYLISLIIAFNLIGWWAINTSITGNAICTMFNIDYSVQKGYWVVATIIAGILFTIPSVLGYTSIKWVDYIAVPGGLVLCIVGFYLSIKGTGWSQMWNMQPQGTMLTTQAIGLIVGANVSQTIIMADYTRFCRPNIKETFLVPSFLVLTGIALFMMGAVMGIGRGTFDIVAIMKDLGFGWWGFLILWLAQWTSQLVSIYSMGLCLSNMFDAKTDNQRKMYTVLGSVVALICSLLGILNKFSDFLYLTGLLYPAVGSIMVVDFFVIHKRKWQDKQGWNWISTIAMLTGVLIGYYTQYINPIGISAVQSYIVSGIMYYVLTYIKAKISPDIYSPERWVSIKN